MDFFRKIAVLFSRLFAGNSGDAKSNRELRRIETGLRESAPQLYKNGLLQPAFAEAVYQLYQRTKPLESLLNDTLFNPDIKTAHYYQAALFLTSFTPEMFDLYEGLEYNNRKAEAGAVMNEARVYEEQRKKLDLLIKKLGGEEFEKIDSVITRLQQLRDLCALNYVSALCVFDRNFQSANPSYQPEFQAAPLAVLELLTGELYYVSADFQITEGLSRAIGALRKISRPKDEDGTGAEEILSDSLKKINNLISKILTPDTLLKLLKLLARDPSVMPETAKYESKALGAFVADIKGTFESDLQRIKTERQNAIVAGKIQRLFEDTPLLHVLGYNAETDAFLRENSPLSFLWATPFKVFKSFLFSFFDGQIQTFLNDLVIEGFFNNPSYKSEFAALVYNCREIPTKLEQFEGKFTKEKDNCDTLIRNYIADSRRDESFQGKLTKLVNAINAEAKSLLSAGCLQMGELYKHSIEILQDVKKPSPEFISNVKMLLGSSRNREKVLYAEARMDKWALFFEIMVEYGILAGPIR